MATLTLGTVTRFTTPDGREFKTEREAHEHIADGAREILARSLAPLVKAGRCSQSDLVRIVLTVVPDSAAATTLAQALSDVADW